MASSEPKPQARRSPLTGYSGVIICIIGWLVEVAQDRVLWETLLRSGVQISDSIKMK
jgi:hypothetical protein